MVLAITPVVAYTAYKHGRAARNIALRSIVVRTSNFGAIPALESIPRYEQIQNQSDHRYNFIETQKHLG